MGRRQPVSLTLSRPPSDSALPPTARVANRYCKAYGRFAPSARSQLRGALVSGRLRRVGKDGQIAQHDHVGVEPGSTERPHETLGLEDLIAAGRQRVTVALSALAVVRDQEDAGDAVEWIHVLTSCVSVPAEG